MRRTRHRAPLVLVAVGVLAAACGAVGGDPQAVRGTLTATPVGPSPEAATSPSPARTATSTPPPPRPEPTGPREPTDADRARFVAAHDPAGATQLRHVAVDVDGDEDREILFAYVMRGEGHTRVEIADWNGTEYGITHVAVGGRADDLTGLRVTDINGDGSVDVAVFQSVGASGASVSLWSGRPDGQLQALSAVGGCFDGSHTYGDTGVSVRDEDGDGSDEIRAVCEDPDRPEPLWPEYVYSWADGAYRCDYRETSGAREPCEGTPAPAPTQTDPG